MIEVCVKTSSSEVGSYDRLLCLDVEYSSR
jgi:hypothetical protein